jgi:hypothetical protein
MTEMTFIWKKHLYLKRGQVQVKEEAEKKLTLAISDSCCV